MSGPARPAPPEIVYLDVDDEITSAADRLRRLEGQRIALVLPYGSRVATSRINFRLLAKTATDNGKALEIVAADASARALAASAGLAVYPSVAALESGDSGVAGGVPAGGGGAASGGAAVGPVAAAAGAATQIPPGSPDGAETRVLAIPRSREPVPTVGRRRPIVRTRTAALAAVVLLVLLVGGGLGAYLYLPSATIVLTPTAEALGPLNLTVQARTDVTQPDPATLTVPARTYSFDAAASQTFTTTGKKVTEAKATGDVTFQNCDTGGSISIPAGSRVSTQADVGFLTLARVTLKRAHVFPFACTTSSTAVEAEQAGTAGNVGAGAINRIPQGYDPIVLTVTNTQPTTGGVHDETPQVSQQDVDAAMTQLAQLLRDDLDAKVRSLAGLPPGTVVFPETESLGTPVPSVDPTTLVGQAVATFDLGVTATGSALGVDPSPVTTVAEQRLSSQVGDGWQLQPGSTHVEVGSPTVNGGVVSFPVTATAMRSRIVDHDALVTAIQGLVLAQARVKLEAYGQVTIALWPDWVSTIPTNRDRISLTIGTPAPAPSPTP